MQKIYNLGAWAFGVIMSEDTFSRGAVHFVYNTNHNADTILIICMRV